MGFMKSLPLSLAAALLAIAPGAGAEEPLARPEPPAPNLRVNRALGMALVHPTARAPLLAERGEPVLELAPRGEE